MRHVLALGLCALVGLVATGCDEETKTERGQLGENCTRADDCGSGLACVAGVCASEGLLGVMDAGQTEPRGAEGESCARRADCRSGLACVAAVCVAEGSMPQGANPGEAGGRNETCSTHRDCQAGLGCYGSRCREKNADLTVTGKACVRANCIEAADCCEFFTPSVSCPMYEANCLADAGVASDNACRWYDLYCTCTETCVDNLCVQPQCQTDVDCGISGDVCVGGACHECAADADCEYRDDDSVCNDQGACELPCTRDEQCASTEQCVDGDCLHVGCISDLQCKNMGGPSAQLAVCMEGDCVLPCEADAECGSTQACSEGRCQDIGCSSDTECRLLLGINNSQQTFALCVDVEP